jgi:hypothetical protein
MLDSENSIEKIQNSIVLPKSFKNLPYLDQAEEKEPKFSIK